MSRLRIAAACLAVSFALSGCVSRAPRIEVPVDPARVAANESRRAAIADWRIEGRVAVSNGSQGGSGRIEWLQQDGRYVISLSAPVTRQGWRLSGDGLGARLEGIEGGPRESADVEALLLSATGWEIPVRAMVNWVRGIGAAAHEYGPKHVVYGAGDLPVSIEQADWRIDYRDWHPASDGLPAMPRRIEAQRGAAKVRLVVDRWQAGPG